MHDTVTAATSTLCISDVAPADWDDRIPFPTLSTGFARAARSMGMHALFATAGASQALILIRSVPVPVVRQWTARAKVYISAAGPNFVRALVGALRGRGVSHVRFGDAVWAAPEAIDACEGMSTTTTHLLTFDAQVSEAEALAAMDSKTRAHLRKSMREGVVVDQILDAPGLEAFCQLVEETRDRMRARDVAAATPPSYFRAVFCEMVPRGQATFLLARVGVRAVAGGLFLLSADRMSYYLGASTRDRALTTCHGPTAVFWHAMRLAHAREIPRFDLGAVTPTSDPEHPHYSVYRFKRAFGGRVEPLHGGELVLSPLKCRFQARVLAPVWKRLYPVYFSLVTRHSRTNQTS